MAARSPDLLLPLLSSSAPVTLAQLQRALGQPSRRTTFRYLRQVRYLRSYNHNGRFYTARDPDRFDRFGLFALGDAWFSRDRSLTATVQRLLGESADGFTDKELRHLLHVPVQPFLRAAVSGGHARRELLGGVYVYFSSDPQRGARQLQARQQRCAAAALTPELIIAVLLALLRDPAAQPAALAQRLQGHSPPISRTQVQAVFDRFELAEVVKKGGPTRC